MKTIILAAIVLTISTTAASALTIKNDEGGYVPSYAKKFKGVAKRGERVVIDGPCLSACTLALHFVPNNRICVTPRAVLGIHRFSHDWDGRHPDYVGTQMVIQGYPRPLQEWIAQRGGYAAMPGGNGYWTVQGSDLTRILKPC
jgi:hypothetical protein